MEKVKRIEYEILNNQEKTSPWLNHAHWNLVVLSALGNISSGLEGDFRGMKIIGMINNYPHPPPLVSVLKSPPTTMYQIPYLVEYKGKKSILFLSRQVSYCYRGIIGGEFNV